MYDRLEASNGGSETNPFMPCRTPAVPFVDATNSSLTVAATVIERKCWRGQHQHRLFSYAIWPQRLPLRRPGRHMPSLRSHHEGQHRLVVNPPGQLAQAASMLAARAPCMTRVVRLLASSASRIASRVQMQLKGFAAQIGTIL